MASAGALVVFAVISMLFGAFAVEAGGSRKMLMLGFGARPGYGYGYGLPKPGYGIGYGKPGFAASVPPPARQAPPATGFPGPVIAVDPRSLSSELDKSARVSGEERHQAQPQDFPGPVIAF